MANEEHLAILKQGVEVWNRWREENPEVAPDLYKADIKGANLEAANLRDVNFTLANLTLANLKFAELCNASLHRTNLCNANLNKADLWCAFLTGANLHSTNLCYTNLYEADLRGSCLIEANLYSADLSSANLSGADLSSANLSGADLVAIQALDTSFNKATLTGACIKDWNINSGTDLQDVVCEYIFIKYDSRKDQFTDRRPHDPNQIFAPGEFTKRYQVVLETVELFFDNGINWKAFLASFEELQTLYGSDNILVQGFERKGSGFEIRLAVSPELDKALVERNAYQKYETKLQIIEAHYRAELNAKDIQIEIYKQQSADLLEIAKLQASRPIINQAMASSDNQAKNTTYNLPNSKFGGGFAAEGGIQVGGQFIDASCRQNLTEAAQEIQQLLEQLSATYPTTTSTDRMMVATKAVEEIEKNPALKQRVVSALKAGGTEALKELVDHPAINILLATIEGWQNPT